MDDSYIGELHICKDISAIFEHLTCDKSPQNCKTFYPKNESGAETEFNIATAREVIEFSHLATDEKQFVVLCAKSYSVEAQNALLKILEEPPKNIAFILIAKAKSAVLPTIVSRLRLINHKSKSESTPFELDLKRLELDLIYDFLKNCDKTPKTPQEVKEHIQSLLFALQDSSIKLDERDLQCFDRAFKQADCYVKESYIFTPLLMKILEAKNKCKKPF